MADSAEKADHGFHGGTVCLSTGFRAQISCSGAQKKSIFRSQYAGSLEEPTSSTESVGGGCQ